MRPVDRPPDGDAGRSRGAFTLLEVIIASVVLAIMVTALLGAFSSGIAAVQAGRENLRATQIMIQKTEAIRLFNFPQTTNAVLAPSHFTEFYDPTGTNTHAGGAIYRGVVQIGPAPASIPVAYSQNMRVMTVTVYWTNYIGTRNVVQKRELQTLIARDGIQNYTF